MKNSGVMKNTTSTKADRKTKKDTLSERYRPIGIPAVAAATEFQHKSDKMSHEPPREVRRRSPRRSAKR